jgi:hypothetical protein
MHSAITIAAVLEERVRFALADDEATRDELRRADERTVLAVDGDDPQRSRPSPARCAGSTEHLVADLADARHVDQHAAGGHLVRDAGAVLVELDDVAVLGEQHLQRCSAPLITRLATRACCESCRYSPCTGTK